MTLVDVVDDQVRSLIVEIVPAKHRIADTNTRTARVFASHTSTVLAALRGAGYEVLEVRR